jgi:hypothetical protein
MTEPPSSGFTCPYCRLTNEGDGQACRQISGCYVPVAQLQLDYAHGSVFVRELAAGEAIRIKPGSLVCQDHEAAGCDRSG